MRPCRDRALPTRRAVAVLACLSGACLSAPSTLLGDDLVQVYDAALAHNAALREARAVYEAERFGVPAARGALRPSLDLSASASVNELDAGESDSWEQGGVTLSLVQALYDRADARRLDRAEAELAQAGSVLRTFEQTLLLDVATAYFAVLRGSAEVRLTEAELEAIDRQRRQARQRFDVGLVPRTDVLEAESEYDLAESRLLLAEDALFAARETLRGIAGTDGEPLANLADDAPVRLPQPDDPSYWVDLAVANNPELAQLRLAATVAETEIAVQRGERYPTLDLVLGASLDRTGQDGMMDSESSNIGVELTLPILSGGRTTALIAQASALSAAAEERLVDGTRAQIREARVAYREAVSSVQQVVAYREALSSTEATLAAVRNAFEAGTRTSLDVLEALRDSFAARFDLADARYDLVINRLELAAVAGELGASDLETINRSLVPADER